MSLDEVDKVEEALYEVEEDKDEVEEDKDNFGDHVGLGEYGQ